MGPCHIFAGHYLSLNYPHARIVCDAWIGDVVRRSFGWQLMRSSTKSGAFLVVKAAYFTNSSMEEFLLKGYGDVPLAAPEVQKWMDKKTMCNGPEESCGDHSQLPRIYRTPEFPLDVKNVLLFVDSAPRSVLIDIGDMTTYSMLSGLEKSSLPR